MSNLRQKLKIDTRRIDEINAFLMDPDNPLINDLLAVVEKYGGVEAINRKAAEARQLDNLMARLRDQQSPFVADLEWLMAQRNVRTH